MAPKPRNTLSTASVMPSDFRYAVISRPACWMKKIDLQRIKIHAAKILR